MLLSLGFFLSTPAQASVLYNRIITCLLSKQDDCCELGEEFAFLKEKSLTSLSTTVLLTTCSFRVGKKIALAAGEHGKFKRLRLEAERTPGISGEKEGPEPSP